MIKDSCLSDKITKMEVKYPPGEEPDYIVPEEYCDYRYILGKKGSNPLVAICMNPSKARDMESDMTVNRIIAISNKLGMDGWAVLNIYPERATYANKLKPFDTELSGNNISQIEKFLRENNIQEVWGAWGNDSNIDALVKGKKEVKEMLKRIGVRVFYFGTLTKENNPRHPLQRNESWEKENYTKKYFQE